MNVHLHMTDPTRIRQVGFSCISCGKPASVVYRHVAELGEIATPGEPVPCLVTASANIDFGVCESHRHEVDDAAHECAAVIKSRLNAAMAAARHSLA